MPVKSPWLTCLSQSFTSVEKTWASFNSCWLPPCSCETTTCHAVQKHLGYRDKTSRCPGEVQKSLLCPRCGDASGHFVCLPRRRNQSHQNIGPREAYWPLTFWVYVTRGQLLSSGDGKSRVNAPKFQMTSFLKTLQRTEATHACFVRASRSQRHT